MRLAVGLAFLVCLCACSGPTEPPGDAGSSGSGCLLPFVGDPNLPMEMEVIAMGPSGLDTVTDGSSVSLMFPPQGGRVVFAGVRARNVDPCAVRIAGALRDTSSQQVRVETRIVNLTATGDGSARSNPDDISSFSNIPACPNQWSDRDLYDVPYELSITLTDRDKRQVKKVLSVVPRCDEPGREAECLCLCKGGYVLGASCEAPDAGADVEAGP